MKIGKITNLTGVSARSIRHYEKKGLLNVPRLENNYREFDESVIEEIQTIQMYLGLGLTTDQVKAILFCERPENKEIKEKDEYCDELLEMYQEKLQEVRSQIEALSEAQTQLEQQISRMKNTRRKVPGRDDLIQGDMK
ncbi:MerR family transcriptional regulator [Bacillus sp. Marseille-Q3570]|uniref:MerR family transcriptional regulator n=1 Tax=Bacillus sp. Marseille-Q3570 TaxID=2963522 RepID=UPI0021B6F78A|nr:MerR family transcriptional regulator [Bacillus sp. Marseille-Q3570]